MTGPALPAPSSTALARDGAIANVTAALHAVPGNRIHERVGLALRGGDAIAQSDRAQHAPAVGEHAAILKAGARVEHLAGQLRSHIQALDDVAFADLVRITLGREHHAERRAGVPFGLDLVQPAIERGLAELHEIALHAHHDGLGFGVAEAAVVFEHVGRAVRVDHDAGVQ